MKGNKHQAIKQTEGRKMGDEQGSPPTNGGGKRHLSHRRRRSSTASKEAEEKKEKEDEEKQKRRSQDLFSSAEMLLRKAIKYEYEKLAMSKEVTQDPFISKLLPGSELQAQITTKKRRFLTLACTVPVC